MSRISVRFLAVLSLLSAVSGPLFAQASPYVVTTTTDSVSSTIGMLRFAIESRNSCSAGCPSITFAIPNTDPGCVPGSPNVCMITLAGPLPSIVSSVTPVTISGPNLDGAEILINGNGLAGNGLVAISSVTLTNFAIGGFPTGAAVDLSGTSDVSIITGLKIGFSPTGASLPNAVGVLVESGYTGGFSGVITAAIRNSTGDAIQVGATPSDAITGVQMKNLSLRDNAGLGIDLGNDGTNANDVNDPDTGVNNLQNFPVLTSAAQTTAGNQVRVLGSFNVDEVSMIEYDLELYGTYSTDPEAFISLGVIQFASPGTNTVNFDQTVALPALTPALTAVTATLTKINNSGSLHETSEISAAVPIAPADLELTKSGPASVVAGRSVTWTLTVKNLSSQFAATGVTVTDTLPAGVSGATVTPPGLEWTCSVAGSTVTCTAASLVANYNKAITITANAPVSGASITNSASLTASAGNNVTTNDTGSVTTTLLYSDVTVAKSVSAPTVARGGSLSYNITVTNASIDAGADGVQLVDTLPAGFTFVSASGAGWLCSPAGSTVTCVRTGGELPASTSSILTLAVTASSTAGTYTNTATVSATNETNTANNTATVNVTVVNTAPVGTADTYPATEDQTLTVPAPGVLSNDSDADGDPMTVAVMTGPSSGTLSLASDGSFTYTPNANFNGTDSFSYEISDGTDVSSPVNVTLNVAPVNDAPVAVNDTATTSEDTPVTIPVLSNDSDPDGTTPTVSTSTGATSGTVVCSATSCTYTPNANFNGTDSFTYTITDGTATATATVTITVTAANDAPIAVNDAATTNEDTAVTIPVLSNDSDPDGTTPTVSTSTGATSGTVVCSATSCTYTPNANFNGSDSFTYTITDGSLTSTATVTITVTPVNDAPAAGADSATTTADTPVVINVLSNDSDVDGNPLSVTAWTNGALGTVTCTAAGACTYTPGGTSGTDTFTYTVSDGAGGLTTGTVTVTVGPVPCPTTVVAVSPSGSGASASGTLSWTGGTGASSFFVFLGPAGSGCSSFFGSTSGNSLPYSGLAPGDYDWKVVAEKPGCTAPPESACVRFTVPDPCPNPAPAPVAPLPGAETTNDVSFEWTPSASALRYHLLIFSAATGQQELAVIPQPAAPLPTTMSTTVTAPLGTFTWRVLADFAGGCPSVTSTERFLTVVPGCPTGVLTPLEPLESAVIESSPVLFRWESLAGAIRYDLILTINGTEAAAGSVDGAVEQPALSAEVPAGATLSWKVRAIFEEGCSPIESRTVDVVVSCFPPVLSLQGEVTTAKPYQVRATIVSVGLQYVFEESDTEAFTTVLAQKTGAVDPTGEFVFADFEHEVTEPRAFFYRVRLAQQGCDFSDVGRIVVVPLPPPTSTDTETVVQFGNEEEIRQDLFIPSPTPTLATSYTYIATTDREWMRVEPAGGTIGQAGVTVTVITNPVGLPVGSNTGTVILTFVEIAGGKSGLETTPVTTSTPVSVTLVTPVTNKGKGEPAADSLIIPAVAHASGVNSEWQTDLRLLNMGTDGLKYALNLTVSGEDGTLSGKSSEIELAAGQNSALNDVVKQWYGLGSLPGEGATGTLEIRPLGVGGAGKGSQAIPVTRSLVSLASSRTYNKTPQGTLGEYTPAIPFAAFVGGSAPAEGQKKSVLSLQQLAQSSAYRTNLGVVEASGQPVNVEIRFFNADGARILTVPLSLKAGEHRQLNQVLAANGLTNVTTARAEVEVMEGVGKIAAYASVVDNVTGDPLQVQAVDLATIGARKYVMPGIAHFNTGQARWRTDVQVFNAGLASVSAKLDFYPVGATRPSRTATVEIGSGKIQTLSDIVPTLFGESNTGGAIQISTATNSELVVTGRTYDQRDEGSYGQFMAAVTEDDAIGLGDRPMQVLQLEQSSNIRSNLGLVEVTGKEVRVELSAYPAESRVTPRAELTLKPNEFRQLNAVLKTLNAGTTYNARIALRVIGGEGKIVAYGSAVDNLTQDPTYIPGQ